MDSRRQLGIGLLAVGVALLVAAWWLWGGVQTPEAPRAPRRGDGGVAVAPRRPPPYLRQEATEAPEPPDVEEVLPDPEVAKVTGTCRYIMEWQTRHVHDFVILDNLEAQSQRFTEDDIACLTASGARNAILEYAERNPLVPQLPPGQRVRATP